ncbi:Serine/arginine repetitive matrix protein 4 [Bagarius yarrelli]|uniref:Serine/arginine repetitive matrix protein 4 n=1 Tax=Bagarius yarrelli TaxID=175774 RepID=A0A556VBE2_BAGYA|nr:Serine/arginine repetitive matrix protein 4 [Bagarius yarrelli]
MDILTDNSWTFIGKFIVHFAFSHRMQTSRKSALMHSLVIANRLSFGSIADITLETSLCVPPKPNETKSEKEEQEVKETERKRHRKHRGRKRHSRRRRRYHRKSSNPQVSRLQSVSTSQEKEEEEELEEEEATQVVHPRPGLESSAVQDSLCIQGKSRTDYDSGNDTSSPPSSKTGVSRAQVTTDRQEKLKFMDNSSDSGNSLSSYESLSKAEHKRERHVHASAFNKLKGDSLSQQEPILTKFSPLGTSPIQEQVSVLQPQESREKKKLQLLREAVETQQEAQQEEKLFTYEEEEERLPQSSGSSENHQCEEEADSLLPPESLVFLKPLEQFVLVESVLPQPQPVTEPRPRSQQEPEPFVVPQSQSQHVTELHLQQQELRLLSQLQPRSPLTHRREHAPGQIKNSESTEKKNRTNKMY